MSTEAVLLSTRGLVVFPGTFRVLAAGRAPSVRAVHRHLEQNQPLVLAPQIDSDEEDPLTARLPRIGVLARVSRCTRLPDGTLRVLVEGLERVRLRGAPTLVDGASTIKFVPRPTTIRDPARCAAMAAEVADRYLEVATLTGLQAHEHLAMAPEERDNEHLCDQVFATTDLPLAEQVEALELSELDERLEKALDHLVVQIARHRLHQDVNARVQRAMDDSQREYHLKEQLKAIRTELGEVWGAEADADRFLVRVSDARMPPTVEAEVLREIERLRRIHTDSAEYTLLRTWLEAVCDLPWSTMTTDRTSLPRARKVLDRDHHGLEKAKDRVLEFLAVRQLAPEGRSPILCLVGPPGVGKTSLGQSIANALGRKFVRVALGGVRDETEIRGHRRTYVGAMPGRIVRALIRAGSRNPVLLLDEVDKVGNDFRGDPASALLEVLDPEQNVAFVDHYVDQPFDLTQVLFVATANVLDPIPPALRDRMEVIELNGYGEEDKVRIARRHLLPRVAAQNGLVGERAARIPPDAMLRLIREWTKEAGVRELERQLDTLHRKLARRHVEEGAAPAVRAATLPELLGPPRFLPDAEEHVHDPGVVTGVAWTAAGGELLLIEATKMPGKSGLKVTGSLGEVMKESAEAAWSWLRSHASEYGLTTEALEGELHLHVPAGAIPKDGPSAGVTMVTALASLLLRIPVRERLAMTGEITLRGRVLPVGGLKEKALAARRAGVRTLLLPAPNLADLQELPEEIRKDLTFQPVERMEEVLLHALGLPTPERAAPPRPDPVRPRGEAAPVPRPRRPTARATRRRGVAGGA